MDGGSRDLFNALTRSPPRKWVGGAPFGRGGLGRGARRLPSGRSSRGGGWRQCVTGVKEGGKESKHARGSVKGLRAGQQERHKSAAPDMPHPTPNASAVVWRALVFHRRARQEGRLDRGGMWTCAIPRSTRGNKCADEMRSACDAAPGQRCRSCTQTRCDRLCTLGPARQHPPFAIWGLVLE